jgi:hypothetical protein
MATYDSNVYRAHAILALHPDEYDISCRGRYVEIGNLQLDLQESNDREVLSVLMAAKEFGFAVGAFERVAKELREMQNAWLGAAKQIKQEVAA